jgi:superfamily II DNA or RNA helicase
VSELPAVSARFRGQFSGSVVQRGEAYRDRVVVESRSTDRLLARVRGTRSYHVLLAQRAGHVSGHCSCPFAAGAIVPCKHIWAVLRVAEGLGWFTPQAPPTSFGLDAEMTRGDLPGAHLGAVQPDRDEVQDDDAIEDDAIEDGFADDAAGDDAAADDAAVEVDDDGFEVDGDDIAGADIDEEDGEADGDGRRAQASRLMASRLAGVGRGADAALAPRLWQRVLEQAALHESALVSTSPTATRLHYLLVPEELNNHLLYVHFAVPAKPLASAAGAAPSRWDRPGQAGKSGAAPQSSVPGEFSAFVLPGARARRLDAAALPIERWLSALSHSGAYAYSGAAPALRLDAALFPRAVFELCATGRCHVARRTAQVSPVEFIARTDALRWDEHPEPWRLEFELGAPELVQSPPGSAEQLARGAQAEPGHGAELPAGPEQAQLLRPEAAFQLEGWLVRGQERRPLAAAEVLIGSGLVFWQDCAARFDASGAFALVLALRDAPRKLRVTESELEAFARHYYALSTPPPLRLPKGLELELLRPELRPILDIRLPNPAQNGVPALVTFEYADLRLEPGAAQDRVLDWPARRLILRDALAEQRALDQLAALGVRGATALRGKPAEQRAAVSLAARRVPSVVRALLEQGWSVRAEGRPYRRPGRFSLQVRTGVDWLELSAELEFAGQAIALPALLAALKTDAPSLVLDDGSVGILPEEWLARWGVLSGLGEAKGETLRFRNSEVPLLAALLEQAPDVQADAAFLELQRELQRGARPGDDEPPAALRGELRPYQREGLAFLRFLERTGFGGCLADDMGLGKTVQLLAHLATPRQSQRPSLVIAPRSVLFNWEREASRFTPGLRVLTHFGADRQPPGPHFDAYDLVLTTYALLRRDQRELSRHAFRFVVLDEAQAIKNSASDTARAARSLHAEHRLALSGTPIENHIGELWSLFEFLNPGLLAHSKRLKQALTKARSFDASSAALLARAVRPFLLRRTKAQVAPELPERTEQTLYVELSAEERRSYAELSVYYRAVIRDKIETLGVERATPQVLEALLRLRQAACHPGLLDETRLGEGSAKLDLLLTRLREVLDGGHKALVFSQFTSLLGILRTRLDEQGLAYEYLDGKTLRREECVDRFQNDPQIGLFLVSLKAGGVGLNLTAADYVFILDPWWNPAAEAQAIDRAHRIGQTRSVVAYRLIARDTVEEKVEELQGKKRELVRAVLGDEQSLSRGLTREDLDALLS